MPDTTPQRSKTLIPAQWLDSLYVPVAVACFVASAILLVIAFWSPQ